MDYVMSEDLGRVGDYHGRILTEIRLQRRNRAEASRAWEDESTSTIIYPKIVVLWLDRNQLPYDKLVDDTRQRLQNPRIVDNVYHLVDATGVGMPTIDIMRRNKLSPIGVWITTGNQARTQNYGYTVPKQELINSLQLCLSSNLLVFAKGLNKDHVGQLLHEFKTFKEKKTRSGNTTWEAWREKDHDDLVLSLAINCWWVLKVQGINVVQKKRFKSQNDYDPLKFGL